MPKHDSSKEFGEALKQVEELLSALDRWFKKDHLKQTVELKCDVQWEHLNEIILPLAQSIAKAPLKHTSEPWYNAVDREWRLRIKKRIAKLVDRACKNVAPRPLWRVFKLSEKFGDAAVELCNFVHRIANEPKWRDETINWESYEPILREAVAMLDGQKPSADYRFRFCNRSHAGSPRLLAYTAFLEIALIDAIWVSQFYQPLSLLSEFIRGTLSDSTELIERVSELMGNQTTVPQHCADMDELKVKRSRTLNALRVRKQRRKGG